VAWLGCTVVYLNLTVCRKRGAEPLRIAYEAGARVAFEALYAFDRVNLKLGPFRMCNNEISETQRTQQFN
jgi:hypothetical protein